MLIFRLVANFWRGSEVTELLIQWNGLAAEAVGVYKPQCILSTWTDDADNWYQEPAADTNIPNNSVPRADHLFQVSLWKIKDWSLPAKNDPAVFSLVGGGWVGSPGCPADHEELWDSIYFVSC